MRTLLVLLFSSLAATLATPAWAVVNGRDVFAPANTLPQLTDVLDSGSNDISTFTSDAGEPSHNPSLGGYPPSGGRSAWWRWTAPANGWCTIDLRVTGRISNGIAAASVAVYRPHPILVANVNTIIEVAKSNYTLNYGTDSSATYGRITFPAEEGKVYFIAVDAYDNAQVNANDYRVAFYLRFHSPKKTTRMGLVGIPYVPGSQVGLAISNLTARNTFSGSVRMFGRRTSIRGVVGADGYFIVTVPQPAPAGAQQLPPVTLVFDVIERGYIYSSAGMTDSAKSRFQEVRQYTRSDPFPMPGRHNFALEFANADAGHGMGSCTISRRGRIRGTVEMPDGQRFPFSSRMLASSTLSTSFPFVRYLFRGAGFAWMELGHDITNSRIYADEAHYRRPAVVGDPFYPNGIDDETYVEGGRYIVPPASENPYQFLAGNLGAGKMNVPATMGEGINVPVEIPLVMSRSQITFDLPNPHAAKLKLNRRTGQAIGTVRIPTDQPARTARGIIYQVIGEPINMVGRLSGATKTVKFSITSP